MAVPSSGSLSLFGIAKEIHLDNYNNTVPAPGSGGTNWSQLGYPSISLKNMSTGAGGFDAINTANASADRPNGSSPHNTSEFYSYDHDAVSITQIGSTYSGAYSCSSWQNISIPVSAYKGKTVRFIFHYVSGTNYTGDIQIDQVGFPTLEYFQSNVIWVQTTNTFGSSSFTASSLGNGGGVWQTTTSDTSSYESASWATVAAGTSFLRWNGRSGGTPSGSTGLSSGYGGSGFYVYAETSSSGHSNKNFWLRSGTHQIPSQVGTPYFGFRLGRCGATIGTLEVYIEEI